jgi:cytochrome c551/c552
MAGLDCESCNDLSQPQTPEALRKHCEACHDKDYGDVVQTWLDDAAASRGKAAAAIEEFRKSAQALNDNAARQAALNLADQLEAALKEVDKAGVQHNTEFGDAIYQQIIQLTTPGK